MQKLSLIQQEIYKQILEHYTNENYLNANILFINDPNFVPILLPYGKTINIKNPKEFLSNLLIFANSKNNHDGFIIVNSNGSCSFGSVVDINLFEDNFPEILSENGAARATINLLINSKKRPICILKCRNDLIEYTENSPLGNIIYVGKVLSTGLDKNYGFGLIISSKLPLENSTKLIKMSNYLEYSILNALDLAEKMFKLSKHPDHHDGFYHFNTSKLLLTGPYFLINKLETVIHPSITGLRKLNASLASTSPSISCILLSEETNELNTFGEEYKDIFEVFASKL